MAGENLSGEVVAKRSLAEAIEKAGISEKEISHVAMTGIELNGLPLETERMREPLCLAKGVFWERPSVRTVIDIGAQKYVAIKCKNGVPWKIATNDKCALGTGRYLKMVADLLDVPLEEMGELARVSKQAVEVLSTCAVFAESEIISLIHQKYKPEDISAGVFRGLASRIYGTLLSVGIEENLAIVGGGAKNSGVVRAIEERVHLKIFVPEEPRILTAVGAALIARDQKKGLKCEWQGSISGH